MICEICGKSGKAAEKCAFEHYCSCWYGIPCKNGESLRKHMIDIAKTYPDKPKGE